MKPPTRPFSTAPHCHRASPTRQHAALYSSSAIAVVVVVVAVVRPLLVRRGGFFEVTKRRTDGAATGCRYHSARTSNTPVFLMLMVRLGTPILLLILLALANSVLLLLSAVTACSVRSAVCKVERRNPRRRIRPASPSTSSSCCCRSYYGLFPYNP